MLINKLTCIDNWNSLQRNNFWSTLIVDNLFLSGLYFLLNETRRLIQTKQFITRKDNTLSSISELNFQRESRVLYTNSQLYGLWLNVNLKFNYKIWTLILQFKCLRLKLNWRLVNHFVRPYSNFFKYEHLGTRFTTVFVQPWFQMSLTAEHFNQQILILNWK